MLKAKSLQSKITNYKGDDSSLDSFIDVALEISDKRTELLRKMREAFLNGDNESGIAYAKELCGLASYEESYRADSRIN